MDFENILYSVENGWARIILNRPEHLNALSGAFTKLPSIGGACFSTTSISPGDSSALDFRSASILPKTCMRTKHTRPTRPPEK